MLIPEFILKDRIKYYFQYIKDSIATDVEDNVITKIFERFHTIDDFQIRTEALKYFTGKEIPKIRFGININTSELPAIHIVIPGIQQTKDVMGNLSEFKRKNIFIEQEDEEDTLDLENSYIVENFEYRFESRYQLMIVAFNYDTVMILYYVLFFMILSDFNFYVNRDFELLKIAGSDNVTEQNVVPQTIFSRNINFNFNFAINVNSLDKIKMIDNFSIDTNKIEITSSF